MVNKNFGFGTQIRKSPFFESTVKWGAIEFYLAEGSPIENDTFKNNPDKEYVVFCGIGGQGTLATKTMKEMGIKNVKNITGGMSEWDKLKD